MCFHQSGRFAVYGCMESILVILLIKTCGWSIASKRSTKYSASCAKKIKTLPRSIFQTFVLVYSALSPLPATHQSVCSHSAHHRSTPYAGTHTQSLRNVNLALDSYSSTEPSTIFLRPSLRAGAEFGYSHIAPKLTREYI
jgi:hypothetical protein